MNPDICPGWFYVKDLRKCRDCGCLQPEGRVKDSGTNSTGNWICIDREWCDRERKAQLVRTSASPGQRRRTRKNGTRP